jgi:hypothetical protein
MRYFRFFLGTPRRALASLIAIALLVLVEQFAPGTIASGLVAVGTSVLLAILTLLERFLAPLAIALLPLIIAGVGFRIMLKGFGGGRKKKR